MKGFSAVEVILASALFVIISTGVVGAVIQGVSVNRLGNEEVVATQFASEGLDAVRSIRDRGFANLSAVNATPRSVVVTGGVWTFGADNTSNTLTHNASDNYVRQVTVEPVFRDATPPDGNIVTSGGNLDPLTKKVTSKVTWNFTTARPQSVTLVNYLSYWGATVVPTPTTAPINAVLSSIADAEVDSSPSTTNFGSSTIMQVQNDSLIQQSYMMFDLTPYAGYTLSSATLVLHTANVVNSGSASTEQVFQVANTTWTESGITYANKPAISATQIGTVPTVLDNSAASIPLTQATIQSVLGGKFALAITSSSTDHVTFSTKEATTGKPQLLLTFSAGPPPTPTPTPPPAWAFRKKITIQGTKVTGSGSLSSFPVLINITDANLAANAQTTGNDIKFTASDGITKLNHEIEKYTSSTGNLVAWVQVQSLTPGSNTDIYMYYGNPTATNQQNVTGTWDANYKGVWHLSSVNMLADATSNANTMTNNGSSTSGTGQVDGGVSMVRSSSQYLNRVGTQNGLAITGNLTVEAWAKTSATISTTEGIASKDGASAGNSGYYLRMNASGPNMQFQVSNNGTATTAVSSSGSVAANTWYHTAGVYNGTSLIVYLNGTATSTAYASGIFNSTADFEIGARNGGSNLYDGTIDEVRVSNTARTAGWIQTEYNNMSSPGTFYTLGAQEVL